MKRAKKTLSILLALLMLVSIIPLSVYAATLKITTQPKTSYTEYGATAKATIKATGDGLKYTWYVKNAGSSKYSKSTITKSTYSVKMTDSVKNRSVYCVVKDKKGKTVKSSTATLRMKATITTEPKTTYAQQGATAKLTVAAKGDGLKYTWYIKNAGKSKYSKSSVTKSTYSVKMSDSVHGRYVYCVVTDKYGKTDKSKTAVLRQSATITTEPKSITVKKGETAKVTVKAKGDGLTYQWYVKNAGKTKYSKSSVTKSTYSVTMSDSVNGRYVYCIVTDKYGKTDKSKTVTLKQKDDPLTITTHPKNVTAGLGDEVSFDVAVKGGVKPYTYEWFYTVNALPLPMPVPEKAIVVNGDMVSAVLQVSENHFKNQIQFYCVITDAAGNQVVTEPVGLDRAEQPLTITKQPETVEASVGDTVGFDIVVEGGVAPYTYQWQAVNSVITEWTNIDPEMVNEGGALIPVESVVFETQFLFRCVVTDAAGNQVVSRVVWIEKGSDPLVITQQPAGELETCIGRYETLQVAVSGGVAPYTYQWQCRSDMLQNWVSLNDDNSPSLSGYHTDSLTMQVQNHSITTHYSFRCVITDASGNQVISDATAIVHGVHILTQPRNDTAQAGEQVSFSVAVEGGTYPYTYQWQYMCDEFAWQNMYGSWCPGATTATVSFSIDESEFEYHYKYRCMITDSQGKVIYSEEVWVVEE